MRRQFALFRSADQQLHTTYTSTPTGKIPWHKSFPTSESSKQISITKLTYPSARLAPIDNTSTTWLVTLLAGEELRVNVRGSEDILIVEDFTPAVTIGRSCSCHPTCCIDSQGLESVLHVSIPECPAFPIAPFLMTDLHLPVAHLRKILQVPQVSLTVIASRLELAQPRQWV